MNGKGPAPRKAPNVTIRFRSKVELTSIRRAAKVEGKSLNTFVVDQAANGAKAVLDLHTLQEKSA